jgi:hypothetical protein
MTFTAKLREFPGLPPDYIATAEKRFSTTLEKELGDNVERVLKAYSSAAESGIEEMNEDERALASAWPKAYDKAKSAGFRDLGSADEAYFEVRLG